MSAVSETIVREYFELHAFLVRQHRKYIAQTRREDDDIDFFVLNPQPQKRDAEMPFVLSPPDLQFIARAIVVVKGWHTETFSPSLLANAPEIFRFVEPATFQQAARAFGADGPLLKILVVPALPAGEEARALRDAPPVVLVQIREGLDGDHARRAAVGKRKRTRIATLRQAESEMTARQAQIGTR